MAKSSYLQQIFETILAIPGMHQAVKVDLRLSRKNILILTKVIERGLALRDDKEDILSMIPQEVFEELRQIPIELLKKADLTEVNEKLKGFQ
jgi:hypothetical protein